MIRRTRTKSACWRSSFVFPLDPSTSRGPVYPDHVSLKSFWRQQKDQAALEFHMATEVSRLNVAVYASGALARPLEEQDIRIYTEYCG